MALPEDVQDWSDEHVLIALAPNRQGDMRDSIPRPVQNSWVTPEIWAEMEAVAQGYWARVGWHNGLIKPRTEA